jgi:predicted nuclease of predicted toxin-antitoxin system
MKILVDMNLSPRWVGFLADNGIEAVHWSSIGSPNTPDIEIMAYAQAYGFVVLTNDLDFGFILAISKSNKPSVLQIRTGALGPDRIGGRVVGALKTLSADIEKGALVTIDTRKFRVHLLPIGSAEPPAPQPPDTSAPPIPG